MFVIFLYFSFIFVVSANAHVVVLKFAWNETIERSLYRRSISVFVVFVLRLRKFDVILYMVSVSTSGAFVVSLRNASANLMYLVSVSGCGLSWLVNCLVMVSVTIDVVEIIVSDVFSVFGDKPCEVVSLGTSTVKVPICAFSA